MTPELVAEVKSDLAHRARIDRARRIVTRVTIVALLAVAAYFGWQLHHANSNVSEVQAVVVELREVQQQQQAAAAVGQCRNAKTSQAILGISGGLVFIGDFLRGLQPDGTVTLTPEQIEAANRAYNDLALVRPDLEGLVAADRTGNQDLSPCPTTK